MFVLLPNINVKVICVDTLIEKVEQQVEEDNYKFCLEQKSKLIKSFFVLRLCSELFGVIEFNKNIKLLYLISKAAKLTLLNDYYEFAYATFLKIAKMLSLNFLIDSIKLEDVKKCMSHDIGEYKEVRLKIISRTSRIKKIPDLSKLKRFFKKYNIRPVDSMDNNFNVKLGLFLT